MSNQPTNDEASVERHVTPEMAERLATGQATLAEFAGLGREQLYEIARVGFRLMNTGRLAEARRIYEGLVAVNPFDSVFHCHLGALHLRSGETAEAIEEFDTALRFNRVSVDALAGRGEAHLNRGQLMEAIRDLRAAIELDPQAARPATERARAILLTLKEAAARQPPAAS